MKCTAVYVTVRQNIGILMTDVILRSRSHTSTVVVAWVGFSAALLCYLFSTRYLNKNSSGDEIANVNFFLFLRRYRTRTLKYEKGNLLRLTN